MCVYEGRGRVALFGETFLEARAGTQTGGAPEPAMRTKACSRMNALYSTILYHTLLYYTILIYLTIR